MKKQETGADIGAFGVGGSTVVSLYFGKDFVPDPKV